MTMHRFAGAAVLTLAVALGAAPGLQAEESVPSAAQVYERGMLHLRQGEFDAALAAFQQASAAKPAVERYATQALVVKRVLGIRKYVAEKPVSAKWERMVATLHAFYLQHQSHAAALALARRTYGLVKNAASEARLAEALLAAGHDAEAVGLLATKAAWSRDLHHGVFFGIALARLGRTEEARKLVPRLVPPQDAEPTLLRDRARLDALLGDQPAALSRLQRAFSATPETALTGMKDSVLQCPDFASLFGTPAFEQVMQTQSAVKATSCSGGKDCGSCPKRGGCGKAGEK